MMNINNTELTIEEREILEGLKLALGNAIKEATEKSQLKREESKEFSKEPKALSFIDFLKAMSEIENDEEEDDEITEEDITDFFNFLSRLKDDDDDDDTCECCSECDKCESIEKSLSIDMDAEENINVYSFAKMIKEFEEGYKGYFTDGKNVYGYKSGALLEIYECGVQPADITSSMLTKTYIKKEIVIDNNDVLNYALNGDVINFTLDMDGIKATGTLSYKNGLPSYKIDNKTGMNNSDLILLALFKGKWTL